MHTRQTEKKCTKCGENLVVEDRHITGIKDNRTSSFDRFVLTYRLILTCPLRLGFIGIFRHGHDRLILTEEA